MSYLFNSKNKDQSDIPFLALIVYFRVKIFGLGTLSRCKMVAIFTYENHIIGERQNTEARSVEPDSSLQGVHSIYHFLDVYVE